MELFNLVAEREVIAQLVNFKTEALTQCINEIDVNDFYSVDFQLLFLSSVKLLSENKTLDVVTLWNEVNGKVNLELGQLAGIVNESINRKHCHIDEYAKIIHELADKRRLHQSIENISEFFNSDVDSLSAVELKLKIENIISDTNSTDNILNVSDGFEVALDYLKKLKANKIAKRVSTGITKLDELLDGGLNAGTVNIIGARPGVGKSAFASNILCNMLKKYTDSKPALIFSLEMNNEQVISRILASFSQGNSKDLLKAQLDAAAWHNIINDTNLVLAHKDKAPRLLMCDKSNLTINELKNIVKMTAQRYGGIFSIVLDYVQLMPIDTRNNTRASAIGDITRNLKEIARTYNIPVLALAQLNREIEQRKSAEPMASDIKDSGSIEQDADLIMLLTRKDTNATIHVVKNRNGASGDIYCKFKPECCLFTEGAY